MYGILGRMFKNIYFRLGLISSIFTLASLVVLPRIPIKVSNQYLNLDTYVGGYNLNFFDGKFLLDLREIKKGLDLSGGIRVVLKANMDNIEESERDKALESAKEVISRRVNLLGVSEPYIASSKVGEEYRILVEIPGIDDVTQAVKLIGQTSQLKFKELASDKEYTEEKFGEYYQDPSAWVDTLVTGADLRGADVVYDQQGGLDADKPKIQLKFSPEGREKFVELAKNNINKPIALYLDESSYPLSAPIVSPDLANGLVDDPVISGTFDVKTANALSLNIRAGALPVPVEVLEQKTIGATLGTESVQKSFFAGSVGLLLVLVYMVFMYHRLGILAGIALIIYSVVTLAIFKLVPVVLTLPGIAGFILTIGMATDANILIFERIKEEVLWGKPNSLAIKLGFERAWSSIKDSNISSLLTAVVLFQFGGGPVKGFALTLAIGILVSLFSSIFVVRTLIQVFNVATEINPKPRRGVLSKILGKVGGPLKKVKFPVTALRRKSL
ncbi:MAG: preprotein translocase subunit SecD, preprotein translocase subunit SecD [candidate division WWE3 bacterium GW2011_GWC1_41_7]|uniref:Protein translocase subunit SecD n=3 Tax=Katanobacteria TaxID=422282 RepID=A0A0G0XBN2_UNCKA|nr:MAG: Preprotein translocase subunit SecD [candidate division WWE3 bacterium GW2011_GWB1_41_6]KKS20050.1 MAG: preprotein translocase subunit SecD, preprotein translocase subunit SecD [candidate division WWE3 bacterium GW2011_GWC1_41_7]KKS21792.1 MAG: Preprotein translocase subunit SecD [candidate division WWE3 bacterium GW2011_GWA1_41_8]